MRPIDASPGGSPTALVLAGGDLPPLRLVERLVSAATIVVAADGGLQHASALGVTPDLLVGDMDSVLPDLVGAYPGLEVERHRPDKDELDLELALAAARRRGAATAAVLGAFGTRLDHSLTALLAAARAAAAAEPFRVSLHGGTSEAHLCAPALPLTATWPRGTTVSLVALAGDAVVDASGLAYPVVGLRLPFGAGLGVSNVSTADEVEVRSALGVVAVIAEHEVA